MAKFNLGAALDVGSFGNFASTLLIQTMTDLAGPSDILKKFGIKPRLKDDDPPLEVDVVVTINGIEVPFEGFVEMLEKDLGRMVTARAQVLLQERVGEAMNKFYDLERELEATLKVASENFEKKLNDT